MSGDLTLSRVEPAILTSSQAEVCLLNIGCVTQSWRLAGWERNRSAVLGYQKAEDYIDNPYYLGAIVGRVANRIENALFDLNGETHHLNANDGPNTLHGGICGISTRFWDMDVDGSSAVQFRLHSPAGDQGFPADVDFTVTVSLSGTELTYDIQATVSAPTPINLAQHNYYNLNGLGTIGQHSLAIPADHYLETNSAGIPVQKTTLDGLATAFSNGQTLLKPDNNTHSIDVNLCMNEPANQPVVLKVGEDTTLTMHTDQPGLQVYNASGLREKSPPFGYQQHDPFSGICLEPQGYPNSVNRPDFPSIIATPDTPYRQTLRVSIQSDKEQCV